MSRRTLGKYRLIAELGQGGMADVYLAITSQSAAYFAKLVVIKRLKEHLANDVEFMTMFVDEARIAARLNHPNLVQTIEVGESNGQHYLTMEYLDGQPLHRILNRARAQFPKTMFLSLLLDVLEGIHYAHELKDFDATPLNIVHRDVTPHNIFVVYEGQTKVVDFGIAKAAGRVSETRHGVIKGKVAYMAPEQAMGQMVDRRVDIFAVGVMLFEAATGSRMWKGLKETEIIRRLVGGKIPSPKDVDPTIDDELNNICMRALAYSPDARYATAAALQNDLAAYLHKLGPRPSPRELGSFVAELFADKRTTTQKIIESQLAQLRSEASSTAMPLAALPTSTNESQTEEFSSEPSTATPFDQPSPASTVQDSRTMIDDGAKTSVMVPDRRKMILVAAAAGILAIVAMILTVLLLKPGGGGAANSAPITVTLKATPLETRFSIDDGPLLENPFIGVFPRDNREHRLRAVAPGYPPKDQQVVFDKDIEFRFSLSPAKGGGPAPKR
jgi:serine/threonine-protein kinase